MKKISVDNIKKMMDEKHRFMKNYKEIGLKLDEIIGHTDRDCIGWYHCHCENGDKIWEVLEMIDKKLTSSRRGGGKSP